MFYACEGGAHDCVYLAVNAYWEPLRVALPVLPTGAAWHRFADTSAAPPDDVSEPGPEPLLADQASAWIPGRSALALVARHG
jgi:glycogen operon protein